MQIIVESRDADATPMRELSIARVRFALRRLKALVPRTALDRSIARATRVLTRSLQRSQKPARGRTAKLALGGSHE